ncbi:MAG: hypothetical protein V4676_06470 [Bacteroidota bacterium]
MKMVTRKYFVAVCTLLFLCGTATAQNLTGIWRGYFITETGDQYKLEFQVKQVKTNTVSGVSYSYLDTRFYGKATMAGNFAIKNNAFTIQELRTVEVRNMGGGGTCLMNYKFTYAKSGREEFLEGSYVGKSEDRGNPENNGKWGDCGGGTVTLRRVVESDFYKEPFLQTQPKVIATTPPVRKNSTTTTKKNLVKPGVKTTVRQPAKTVIKMPVQKPAVVQTKIKKDSITNRTTSSVALPAKVQQPRFTAPVITRERRNELTQTVTVRNNEVLLRLYDNGEIDNDTISLYLDGELILSNKRLSAAPLSYTLKLSEENPEHTLVMVAENLGRIPPNTSLMIVQDGDKRYQVSITSTEQKNAMVRFRYVKD